MTTAWFSLTSCEAAMLSPTSWSVKKPECLSPSGSSLLQRSLVRLAGQRLDHPPGDHDRGVVVSKHLSGRRELRQLLHAGDIARDRILAAAEVAVVVAHPAGAVVQQLPHRDARGGGFVGELEVRQIFASWGGEIDLALLDQAHHGRGGESLGGRADAEERFGVDRQRMVDVGDAEALEMLAALPEDADRDAGHMVARHRRFDPLVELAEQRSGRLVTRHGRDLRPRAPSPRRESQRTGGRGDQRPPREHHPAAHLPHSVTDDTDFGSSRKRASVS
jgi:hypothetical protein